MRKLVLPGLIAVVLACLAVAQILCGAEGGIPDGKAAPMGPNYGLQWAGKGSGRAEFERRYQALQEHVRTHAGGPQAPLMIPPGWRLYLDIAQMGPPALPYVMEKMEAGDWQMEGAVWMITRRRFARSEYADERYRGDARTKARMYVEWWHNGPEGTRKRFSDIAARWGQSRTGDKTVLWTTETFWDEPDRTVANGRDAVTAAGEAYLAVEDLGIAALPSIVDMLKQDKCDFLQIALDLTENEAAVSQGQPASARAQRFLGWWTQNKEKWTIPWPDDAAETAPGQ